VEMAISDNGYLVCDYCGDDTGMFNDDTGNHPGCEEAARLRAELERLSAVTARLERRADPNDPDDPGDYSLIQAARKAIGNERKL
jgi:hypothetical protein